MNVQQLRVVLLVLLATYRQTDQYLTFQRSGGDDEYENEPRIRINTYIYKYIYTNPIYDQIVDKVHFLKKTSYVFPTFSLFHVSFSFQSNQLA
jgi:hypothetical protein